MIRSDVDRASRLRARAPLARPGLVVAVYLAIVALACLLRLHGIADPILDHPGWRQGDTAAIARNFATLDLDPLRPQTDYDGPPPNYVELELQIVPFLAALLYKLFGVHEVFGRLLSIAFSLGTVVAVGRFARFLFRSETAGVVAALALALAPGSIYYGRTFMPDTTMTFFLTVAVYAAARMLFADGATGDPPVRRVFAPAALAALAVLAKPVALVGLAPIAAMWLERAGPRALRRPATYAFVAIALAPYALYDASVARIAEWHWASGITRLHVLPGLAASFASPAAFAAKLGTLGAVLGMLSRTMLGRWECALALAGLLVAGRGRSRAALFAWLAGALAYAYVVVTVERVDYYLYPFVPLAALAIGGLGAFVASRLPQARAPRVLAATAAVLLAVVVARDARTAIAPYYRWNRAAELAARALDRTLAPGALIVMGHYDPSILYTIGRKGWEEDPYLWTPFDEQSAIAKGARYYVDVEHNRLLRNVELAAWLRRFPLRHPEALWGVYETDPAKTLPGAEARWRAFRDAERAGALPREAGDATGGASPAR